MSEIDDDIRLYTGGIRVAPFLSTNHSCKHNVVFRTQSHTQPNVPVLIPNPPPAIDSTEEGVSFSSYCLDRNQEHMYDLLGSLVRETNFDNVDKLRTLIQGVSLYISCLEGLFLQQR